MVQALQLISIELLITLIKDFRQDIYEDFVTKIMPATISIIDMQKIDVIDKVFTLISFGIKYLSRSI